MNMQRQSLIRCHQPKGDADTSLPGIAEDQDSSSTNALATLNGRWSKNAHVAFATAQSSPAKPPYAAATMLRA